MNRLRSNASKYVAVVVRTALLVGVATSQAYAEGTTNQPKREGGLRSDGELVQATKAATQVIKAPSETVVQVNAAAVGSAVADTPKKCPMLMTVR